MSMNIKRAKQQSPAFYPGAKHLDKTQQTQDGGRE